MSRPCEMGSLAIGPARPGCPSNRRRPAEDSEPHERLGSDRLPPVAKPRAAAPPLALSFSGERELSVPLLPAAAGFSRKDASPHQPARKRHSGRSDTLDCRGPATAEIESQPARHHLHRRMPEMATVAPAEPAVGEHTFRACPVHLPCFLQPTHGVREQGHDGRRFVGRWWMGRAEDEAVEMRRLGESFGSRA